ncbi:hypothetical protein TruAng_006887 [Truncatella angustata]|nr:hypothetical protein TruAng_006887 [Truncatella angustata]
MVLFALGYTGRLTYFDHSQWEPLDGQSVSLSLKCNDCRTWGQLTASATFPDDFAEIVDDFSDLNPFNDIDLAVQFNGVGALIDVGIGAALDGTVKVPLFITETPLGIAIPGSQIGIVFSVDLVLGLTGEVNVNGGFQITVPDTSSFTLSLDPTKDVVAQFNGASASLLPLTADVPANVTMALQLGVQAGVQLTAGISLGATALAGAFINIPQITIGEQFSTNQTCLPAFAEIDINAGVFVDVGANIGIIDLPGINPTAATTLFSASTSTCFGDSTPSSTATTAPACPVDLVTQTIMTMPTQSLVACAVSAINCPASLAQTVLVEGPQVITTSICPVGVGVNTTSVSATYSVTNAVTLSVLPTPVTSTVSIDPTVTAPAGTVSAIAALSPTAVTEVGTVGPIGTRTITRCGSAGPTASASGSLYYGAASSGGGERGEGWVWPSLRAGL